MLQNFQKNICAIALTICFFLAQRTNCQELNSLMGFYIDQNKDTVAGFFYTGNAINNEIKFKKTNKDPWQKLSPNSTFLVECENGAHFESRELISKSVANCWIFVELILNGPTSLFIGQNGSGAEKIFFIRTPSSPDLLRVNKTAMDSQFKLIFGTCFATAKNKPIFGRASLITFIQEMNRCTNPTEAASSTRRKNLDFKLGLCGSAFYYHMDPSATNIYNKDFRPVNKVSIGIGFRLKFGRFVGLETGFNFVNKRMETDSLNNIYLFNGSLDDANGLPDWYTNLPIPYRDKLDIVQKFIEVPLSVIVELKPNSILSPTLSAGVCMEIPVKNMVKSNIGFVKSDEIRLNQSPNVYPYQSGPITYQKPDFGFIGGFGARYKLNNKSIFGLSGQYFAYNERIFNNQTIDVGPILTNTSRIQLTLNYTWFFSKS